MQNTKAAKPGSTDSSNSMGDLGQLANLGSLLGGQCYFKCRGLVITPAEDMNWKGEKGNVMYMRKIKVLAGDVVVTHKDMGDNTEDFINVPVGSLVDVNIRSAKTEKGNIEVMGDLNLVPLG